MRAKQVSAEGAYRLAAATRSSIRFRSTSQNFRDERRRLCGSNCAVSPPFGANALRRLLGLCLDFKRMRLRRRTFINPPLMCNASSSDSSHDLTTAVRQCFFFRVTPMPHFSLRFGSVETEGPRTIRNPEQRVSCVLRDRRGSPQPAVASQLDIVHQTRAMLQ